MGNRRNGFALIALTLHKRSKNDAKEIWLYSCPSFFVYQNKFMPYKSLAQERYFNSNRAKLEKQGVNVDEWNKASAGKKLPMRINKKVKVAKKLLKKYKNL